MEAARSVRPGDDRSLISGSGRSGLPGSHAGPERPCRHHPPRII